MRFIICFNNFIFRLYLLRDSAETGSEKNVGAGPIFPSKHADIELRELAEQSKNTSFVHIGFLQMSLFRRFGFRFGSKRVQGNPSFLDEKARMFLCLSKSAAVREHKKHEDTQRFASVGACVSAPEERAASRSDPRHHR